MTEKDLLVTPIVILLVFMGAYLIRPYVTNSLTRKYYFPALLVKITGALAVGFIYQFYYGGGDTFGYHTHGSQWIWKAIMDSPLEGLKLLFMGGKVHFPETYQYSSQIWYFRDGASFSVIRVAAFFDILTGGTYAGTAVLFATFAFSGGWMWYKAVAERYPTLSKWLAIAILFVPTVVFWGSGILKDSITLALLGWVIYALDRIIYDRVRLVLLIIVILSFWGIYMIKIYILLCLIPALLFWIFFKHISRINSIVLRGMIGPLIVVLNIIMAYYILQTVSGGSKRYSLDKIAETAKITAYDIRYGWGARDGIGSGYSLGELDGTFSSMIRLAPSAINVSLFRPYLFEAGNPLMMMTSLEALGLLIFTLVVIYKVKLRVFRLFFKPDIFMSLLFSISFAFAVGISTYNFGTLSRYKIPLVPFYLVGLILMMYYSNKERKLDVLESTEKD